MKISWIVLISQKQHWVCLSPCCCCHFSKVQPYTNSVNPHTLPPAACESKWGAVSTCRCEWDSSHAVRVNVEHYGAAAFVESLSVNYAAKKSCKIPQWLQNFIRPQTQSDIWPQLTWMSLSHRLGREHERAVVQQITHCASGRFSEIWGEKVPMFPPTGGRDRSEVCFVFLLLLSGEKRKGGRQTALLPLTESILPNSTSESTWSYIYGKENTRTRPHTHCQIYTLVMWIHGTVHSRGRRWLGGH